MASHVCLRARKDVYISDYCRSRKRPQDSLTEESGSRKKVAGQDVEPDTATSLATKLLPTMADIESLRLTAGPPAAGSQIAWRGVVSAAIDTLTTELSSKDPVRMTRAVVKAGREMCEAALAAKTLSAAQNSLYLLLWMRPDYAFAEQDIITYFQITLRSCAQRDGVVSSLLTVCVCISIWYRA